MDTKNNSPPSEFLKKVLVDWFTKTATNLGVVFAMTVAILFTTYLNGMCYTDSLTGGMSAEPLEEIVVTASKGVQ